MTLIISYLVVSKVNLAISRYMEARVAVGNALCCLRELNQLALMYTERDRSNTADIWRDNVKRKIISLLDCTCHVIRDEKHAAFLAKASDPSFEEDPYTRMRNLRNVLYNDSLLLNVDLLERCKLVDMLNDFAHSYRTLLMLASTPIPFTLVQMGRTFVFIFTFTIPFALLTVQNDLISGLIFLFFLTYGFLGLEFVAIKLQDPFGDGVNDLNVTGMRRATVRGIEKDLESLGDGFHQESFRNLPSDLSCDAIKPTNIPTGNNTSKRVDRGDDRMDIPYHAY